MGLNVMAAARRLAASPDAPGFWLRLPAQRDLWQAQHNRRRIKIMPFPKAAQVVSED